MNARKIAVVIVAAIGVAGCGGQAVHHAASAPAAPSSVQTLPQPPTPQQVATTLHATGFTDCGPAPGGGVTDHGTAYLRSERIGIDTFPGPGIRDSWKKVAAGFGIAPFAQGTTWVAYKATAQHAKGCN